MELRFDKDDSRYSIMLDEFTLSYYFDDRLEAIKDTNNDIHTIATYLDDKKPFLHMYVGCGVIELCDQETVFASMKINGNNMEFWTEATKEQLIEIRNFLSEFEKECIKFLRDYPLD